jgi:hypothetical protein
MRLGMHTINSHGDYLQPRPWRLIYPSIPEQKLSETKDRNFSDLLCSTVVYQKRRVIRQASCSLTHSLEMKLHPTGAVVDIHAACREAIQNFRIIMQADILLPQCKSTPDSGGRRHWCSCTSAQVTLEFYQPHQRHLFGPGTGTELILPTVRISNLFTLKSFSEASTPLIVAHLHLPPVACIVK